MNTLELSKFIGRTGLFHVFGKKLEVHVKIMDVRAVFGRVDFRVEPTAGAGLEWVDKSSVRLDPVK